MAATPVALTGNDATIYSVGNNSIIRYMGLTVAETGGAASVHIRIRVGSASGEILDTIHLNANQSVSRFYGPMGLLCNSDLYEEKVAGAGAYEGSVYVL